MFAARHLHSVKGGSGESDACDTRDTAGPDESSDEPSPRSGIAVADGGRAIHFDEALMRWVSHTDRLAQIGVLAASVAHEINNPAAFIMANLTVMRDYMGVMSRATHLLETVVDELPPSRADALRTELSKLDLRSHVDEFGEMVDDNLSGIGQIAQIVATLRSFSRSDGEVSPVDIATVLETSVQMLGKRLRDKAAFEVEIEPVPTFTGEPRRLGQVIMILLSNALHAVRDGERSRNSIRVHACVKNNRCVVAVEDNGCGISPDVQERMFDPFFTTKPDGEGTGLGLALCRNIAQKHGGQIHCVSIPGIGTRFELTIPLDARPSTPADDEGSFLTKEPF